MDIIDKDFTTFKYRKMCLHPVYHLRQDDSRVILTAINEEKYNMNQWLSFILPLHAKILSFIKGEQILNDEINKCADFLDVSPKIIINFLLPLINNTSWKRSHLKNGQCVHFPPFLIVECTEEIKRTIFYKADDFSYNGIPDLVTDRLSYPISIMLELTMKCYVNCAYCYADRSNPFPEKSLKSNEIIKLIQEFHREGGLHIDINGGEVLMLEGIKDILIELDHLHYSPLISTKMPLDEKMIIFLKSLQNVRLQVSLDSIDSDILAKLIRAPEDYIKRMSETFTLLDKHNLKVQVNCVLTKINSRKDSIIKLNEFLNQFQCVTLVRFNFCGYSLYKEDIIKLLLSYKEITKVEETIRNISNSHFPIILGGYDKLSDYTDNRNLDNFNRRALCTGNIRNIVILPNGNVTICEELYNHPKFILGNIRESSLKDIWKSKRALDLFEKSYILSSKTKCSSCETWDECRKKTGVCWKMVLMAYGKDNWNFPDPRCPRAPVPYNEFYVDDKEKY